MSSPAKHKEDCLLQHVPSKWTRGLCCPVVHQLMLEPPPKKVLPTRPFCLLRKSWVTRFVFLRSFTPFAQQARVLRRIA
eukprot:scaffold46259_cov21-Tisochrysis_lutea.AAC.3